MDNYVISPHGTGAFWVYSLDKHGDWGLVHKKIFITGTVGTGKSTVCDTLTQRGKLAIDIDEVQDLCYLQDKNTGFKYATKDLDYDSDLVKNTSYICDVDELNKILCTSDDDIFVAGSAENQIEFFKLFDFVFLLQCKPPVFIDRIIKRKNTFGKDKSVQDLLVSWYTKYERDQLMNGAIPINTEKPVDDVVDDILNCINEKYRIYLMHSQRTGKP